MRSVFVIGPDKKVKLTLTYPASTGRNFDEILRVIDSLQLTANYKVATPANWKDGEDVIIVPAVSDEDAKELFPERLGRQEAVPARRRPARQVATDPVRLDPRPHLRGQHLQVRGGVGADHGGADRHVRAIGIHDDWLGAQAPGQFRAVELAGHMMSGPVSNGQWSIEQLDPLAPEVLVVEVGAQVVADLDHAHRRVQLAQPRRPEGAGGGVGARRC